jgi:threonine aldolase
VSFAAGSDRQRHMDTPIDLRSDTVSRPSDAMRRAMAEAEVGDDWYGDDPTVNRLQDMAAELTGKEAAAFLPTGTMCNQIAMHAYVRAGHVVVCEATAHTGGTEASSAAVLSGIAFHRVGAHSRGLLTAGQVAAALEPHPYDVAVVDLVTIENTHQVGGGAVMQAEDVGAIARVCAARKVPLYIDGARIFNACAVTGAAVADYAAGADAMMFALSKGLGAPIGSILVGDREFIRETRRLKILFGGAWRQAGIMAAAGLIALAEGPARLPEDHANARRLAEGLAGILPGAADPAAVETNIVFADVTGTGHTAVSLAERLAAEGVLVTVVGSRVRMLTHVNVTADGIETALRAWQQVVAATAAR